MAALYRSCQRRGIFNGNGSDRGLFIYTHSLAVLYMGLAAISIAVGWGCLILTGLRRHLDQFMTATGELMDAVMASGNTLYEDTAGPALQQMGHLLRNITDLEEDTLLSRLGNRILRLYEVVQNSRSRVEEEKQRLQELFPISPTR